MTKRLPCPPAPGPLEAYAAGFDDLFGTLAQRRGFREYLAGLLLPRDRNKTLTCLAGTEPVAGAQHAAVQRLQFFLSESTWDGAQINARRLELMLADPATAPHDGGVLVIDDSGDRKDGSATAHVGKQYLGSVGKIDRGVVTVTTCWADERLYYPLHAVPYTPAHHFPGGKNDPAFRTKLQIGAALARAAKTAGVVFRAVVADCAYGDHNTFRTELSDARMPFVMALKRGHGTWQYEDAFRPVDAARELAWHGPEQSGDWQPVTRTFRNGRTATWWAADAQLDWRGPNGVIRLVVATTHPATLPETSTWYLATNLPRPGSPREAHSRHPAADLTEVVRLSGLRHWVEQSYKQVKDELGRADFQARSDTGIRRHQTLVNCAFSFCWNTWFTPDPLAGEHKPAPAPERGHTTAPPASGGLLAPGHPRHPWLVDALGHAATLLPSLDDQPPARRTQCPAPRRQHRQTPRSLLPDLTNHR